MPNKPDAVNPALARWFAVEAHWPAAHVTPCLGLEQIEFDIHFAKSLPLGFILR